ANWGTLHGLGPFVRYTPNESLLLLQAFMGTMAMMTLLMAANVKAHARTEAALARVAAIVESSDDAIIGKTLDGIITTWNAGAERLYGYAAHEVIGWPIALIIPRGLAAAAAHEINNPLAVVVGQAQLLEETLDAAGRRRLEEILEAARRIQEIVDRLKRINRLELADTSQPVPEMLDIEKSSSGGSGVSD